MFLYAVMIQIKIPTSTSYVTELAEIINAESIHTSSRGYLFRRERIVNRITIRLPGGIVTQIDLEDKPLPAIGSYVQVKKQAHILSGDHYSLYNN